MTMLGQCKLCLQQKDLMDSHFIPASIYKLCRDTATGQNPIAVSGGRARHTTDQIRDYVFCSDCEKRLNDNGEAWFHLNMARPEGFVIREELQKVSPSLCNEKFAAYEGRAVPGIDMDQLCYFGLSIFWRASAHRWPKLGDNASRIERLDLNGYEEPIRLFLLNNAPAPDDISLLISVWPYENPAPPFVFNTPVGRPNGDFLSYLFYGHGVDFKLLIGKAIPPNLKKMSAFSLPERYIFASESGAAEIMNSFGKVVRGGVAVGKLALEFPEQK